MKVNYRNALKCCLYSLVVGMGGAFAMTSIILLTGFPDWLKVLVWLVIVPGLTIANVALACELWPMEE